MQVVEQAARRTLAAVTTGLLEQAQREPALALIYAVPTRRTLTPAAARRD